VSAPEEGMAGRCLEQWATEEGRRRRGSENYLYQFLLHWNIKSKIFFDKENL
jgi:hypothetical protein